MFSFVCGVISCLVDVIWFVIVVVVFDFCGASFYFVVGWFRVVILLFDVLGAVLLDLLG